jgi:hypothetical protein
MVHIRAIAVQSKAFPANEVVAIILFTERKRIADEVKAECPKAGVQKVLENDVLGILGPNGPHGKLQGSHSVRLGSNQTVALKHNWALSTPRDRPRSCTSGRNGKPPITYSPCSRWSRGVFVGPMGCSSEIWHYALSLPSMGGKDTRVALMSQRSPSSHCANGRGFVQAHANKRPRQDDGNS